MARRSRAKPEILTDQRPYTGVLQKRIIVGTEINEIDGAVYPSPQGLQAAKTEQASKLPDLFDFFDIDQTSDERWERLALALAEHCVPGMSIAMESARRSGGRPKIWNDETTKQFVARVEQLMSQGRPKKSALEQAAKELDSAAGLSSLQNRYSARAKWAIVEAKAAIFLQANPRLAKLLGL